jgi:hypothetical protein
VILGPTEHRVARWLADMTRHGLVTIRTVDLAEATHVERSEAYRITARLRILGLFGIENDRGGNHGGRKIWRTAVEHDAAELDAVRHREAWARVVAWARARRDRISDRLAAIRANHTRPAGVLHAADPIPAPDLEMRLRSGAGVNDGQRPPGHPEPGGRWTFAEAMRRNGAGRLLDAWGVQ